MHHSVERLQLRTHERREGRNEMPNLLLKVPSLNETSRTPFAWANGGIVVYTMYYAIPCASYGKIYSTTHTRKKRRKNRHREHCLYKRKLVRTLESYVCVQTTLERFVDSGGWGERAAKRLWWSRCGPIERRVLPHTAYMA